MALIGKSNRQSVLDENASLFQAEEKKSLKQTWAQMNRKERRQYFLDYFLFKIIIAAALIGIIIYIAVTVLRPQKDILLFAAVFQYPLELEKKDDLTQKLESLFVSDKDLQEIRVDDSFPDSYESQIKLQAYITAKDLDIIITDEEQFSALAKTGYFEDLNKLMPEFAQSHPDSLYWISGYIEKTAADETDSSSLVDGSDSGSKENIKAYGIQIKECQEFQTSASQNTAAVAGIMVNSQRKEAAQAAIEKLLH